MNPVDRYEREGAVLLRGAFDEAWVDSLRHAVAREMSDPGRYSEDYVAAGERGRFFETSYLWRRHREFHEFARRSPAKTIARTFMGSRTTRLFYDQVFVKEPGTEKPTPWHQDKPYWAVQGSQMCSLWIALDEISAADCVVFIAGSHRWGAFQARHFIDDSPYAGQELLRAMPDISMQRQSCRILHWDMEPGDCIVFHPLTIHGAPGNSSLSTPRRAVASRWLGEDVVYCKKGSEYAFPRGTFSLSDGDPLPTGVVLPVD